MSHTSALDHQKVTISNFRNVDSYAYVYLEIPITI